MTKLKNWQKHFPYSTPRQNQAEALDMLEKEWDNYDVFIMQAPTAFGKSAIAKTILNACKSVSYLTPTNQLVDQFLTEFPDTPTLQRLDSYHCEDWQRSCSSTRSRQKKFCKGCPAASALAKAKYRSGPGVYNYHTYLAYKLYRDVLVVDEAHNLLPQIRERMALRVWRHDYAYPRDTRLSTQDGYGKLLAWIDGLSANRKKHKKIQILRLALTARRPEFVVSRTMHEFNGKGTVRGIPEERDCLELLPVDISTAPPVFWPREVKKTILLSATLSEIDVQQLGFRGRVCYISCKSPIPPMARPIILDPVRSVNYGNLQESAVEMATYIRDVLAPRHTQKKGLIHASYRMAELMRPILQLDPRFHFHDRLNKREQYQRFREEPVESGAVLVACGMYEGIDLPEDLGRWQVLAKVPWQSLGNPAVKYKAQDEPDWYNWETLRTVIQACGRICRSEQDFGATYILDSSVNRLLDQAQHLIPDYFMDALVEAEEWDHINGY